MNFKELPEYPIICANVRALPFPDNSRIAPGRGGESGLVGCLLSDNESNSALRPEHSAGFICGGLVQDDNGRNRNVDDFAQLAMQQAQADDKIPPGIIIAASSSEAGKTVLCSKLIRSLSDRGIRVGAIKATGTGGGLDGVQYRNHGAIEALDQIDAGLITTHGSRDLFQQRIPRIYHRMAARNVHLILTELGGDLVSANNPAFFAIEELMQSMGLMIVIANDALAAYGIAQFCRNTLGFPIERIRFMTSPFRNHEGMKRRFHKVAIERTYDPNSAADLNSLVDEIVQTLPHGEL